MLNKYADRYKKIGKQIQHYRKTKELTQEQLSERVRISKSYLSKIEAQNCNKSFSLEVLFEIADALEIPVSKLFE